MKKREIKPSEKIDSRKEGSMAKLSTTGQQAIKNADTNANFTRVNPGTTATSGYSYYTKPPVESSSTSSLPPKTTQPPLLKPASFE